MLAQLRPSSRIPSPQSPFTHPSLHPCGEHTARPFTLIVANSEELRVHLHRHQRRVAHLPALRPWSRWPNRSEPVIQLVQPCPAGGPAGPKPPRATQGSSCLPSRWSTLGPTSRVLPRTTPAHEPSWSNVGPTSHMLHPAAPAHGPFGPAAVSRWTSWANRARPAA